MRIFTSDQFYNNQIKATIMAGIILLSLIMIEELVFFSGTECEDIQKKYEGQDVNLICDNYLVLFFVAPNLILFFVSRSFILRYLEKKRNKTWRSYK